VALKEVSKASILFYDLSELERTCPGYQEYTYGRIESNIASGYTVEDKRISQVRIGCTIHGVETVYFLDMESRGFSGIRLPPTPTRTP